MKTCTVCGEMKEERAFYKKFDKLIAACMVCVRGRAKKRYVAVVRPRNKEQARVNGRNL